MNVKTFKKYLKQFNVKGKFVFQEDKKGYIKVISKEIMSVKIRGEKGIYVYKNGITKGFISALNPNHRKIDLTKDQIMMLGEGKELNINLEDGEYIGSYKGVSVLPLYVLNNKMKSRWLFR